MVGKILKVNGSGCRDFHFYITLTVKTSDGEKLYFQAKVVRSLEGSLDFPVVRPRVMRTAIHSLILFIFWHAEISSFSLQVS